jgi:hypothetical protein
MGKNGKFEAEGKLQELKGKRDKLRERIQGLEAQAEKVEFTNVDEAVKHITRVQGELLGAQEALLRISAEVALYEGRMADYQALERAARVQELRGQELVGIDTVAALLLKMQAALGSLEAVRDEIRKNREYEKGAVFGRLDQAVKATCDYLKQQYPELIGLDPLPSPEEMRLREAKLHLRRMQDIKAYYVNLMKEKKEEHDYRLTDDIQQRMDAIDSAIQAGQAHVERLA